jgi:hypothetical protein
MIEYATNKKIVEPQMVEFRLTGLQFVTAPKAGNMPRKKEIVTPLLIKRNNQVVRVVETSPNKIPIAHFYISGLYVFKDKAGKQYGITTEGKTRTWIHSPYDDAYAAELARIKNKHGKDLVFIGRSHDGTQAGVNELKAVSKANVFRYLKITPGDLGKGLTIIKMIDIYPDYMFPDP